MNNKPMKPLIPNRWNIGIKVAKMTIKGFAKSFLGVVITIPIGIFLLTLLLFRREKIEEVINDAERETLQG